MIVSLTIKRYTIARCSYYELINILKKLCVNGIPRCLSRCLRTSGSSYGIATRVVQFRNMIAYSAAVHTTRKNLAFVIYRPINPVNRSTEPPINVFMTMSTERTTVLSIFACDAQPLCNRLFQWFARSCNVRVMIILLIKLHNNLSNLLLLIAKKKRQFQDLSNIAHLQIKKHC